MQDILANKYECIEVEIEWTDETDKAIDLDGRVPVILDAMPPILKQASFLISSAAEGKTRLFVSSDIASKLGNGRANWIRLGVRVFGGCLDSLPPLWINIQ